jgi:hypothetical protein
MQKSHHGGLLHQDETISAKNTTGHRLCTRLDSQVNDRNHCTRRHLCTGCDFQDRVGTLPATELAGGLQPHLHPTQGKLSPKEVMQFPKVTW